MACKYLLFMERVAVRGFDQKQESSYQCAIICIAGNVKPIQDCPKKRNPFKITPHCWRINASKNLNTNED